MVSVDVYGDRVLVYVERTLRHLEPGMSTAPATLASSPYAKAELQARIRDALQCVGSHNLRLLVAGQGSDMAAFR